MMNEPFPIEVRRYLVETANERPADDQLEAVLRVTAAKPQQQPWLIRLRWLVSPAAPVGNAALRFGIVVAALLIAAAMVAVLGGGSGPGRTTVFEGRWTSIDIPDNSTQTLIVGAGLAPIVHYEDAYATGCADRGDADTLFIADGPGLIDQNRLSVHFPGGGCTTWQVPVIDVLYEYQAATDTLLDQDGIVWHRLS